MIKCSAHQNCFQNCWITFCPASDLQGVLFLFALIVEAMGASPEVVLNQLLMLCGGVRAAAGFACMIEQDQLAEICAGHQTAGLPDWEDFKADLQAGLIQFPSVRTPFLFAGTVLDAPAAAVYQLKQDGKVVGVCVSSEAAGD